MCAREVLESKFDINALLTRNYVTASGFCTILHKKHFSAADVGNFSVVGAGVQLFSKLNDFVK